MSDDFVPVIKSIPIDSLEPLKFPKLCPDCRIDLTATPHGGMTWAVAPCAEHLSAVYAAIVDAITIE